MKTIVFVLSVFLLIGAVLADTCVHREDQGAPPLESDFDRFFCNEIYASGECAVYRASIINLITTPEKFHGKMVSVEAYLLQNSKESTLYFSEKEASPFEAVGVSFADGPLEKQAKTQFKYCRVLIKGEFDMYAHNSFVRGSLRKITRLEKRGCQGKM
jgi:hypothetical protein